MCKMLYIIENGCKWKTPPKKYGNWRIVYMKFSRWSKNSAIVKTTVFLLTNKKFCFKINNVGKKKCYRKETSFFLLMNIFVNKKRE